MSVSDLLEVLQPFIFGGLAVAAFIEWRRRPGPPSAWLAASFGVLGLVVVASQLLPEVSDDPFVLWSRKAMISILVLFPYCLYRFMTSLIRPIRWIWIAAPLLTAAVALGALVLPDFPEAGEPRPVWFQLYIAALLTQWVFLSGVVAVRLWRGGQRQPTVARRRMRTMSVGAMGLALALVVAGEASQQSLGVAMFVQLMTLGTAPLILLGFAPPYVLRVAWRRPEEAALNESGRALMAATDDREVARTLLPNARALLGAEAALLENMQGEVIATDGLDKAEALAIITSLRDDSGARDGPTNGSLIEIPMSSGRLVIITNPLTPFFGHDELTRLGELAALADLAFARNQLLGSQRRLAAVVESSDDAIVLKSLGGVIEEWNPGAERIYGYRPDEVLGKSISILVPSDIENDVPALLGRVRRGESIQHYETKRQTKDGRVIDVSLTVSPVRDASGAITGVSTIARDVSRRLEAEQDREAAREEADRANRAKSDFLSRMSHELRTPLNAVLGFAQLLEMDLLTPEQKESTAEIIKAGKHLLELINEVLDISRIEAGRMRLSLEPVDALQVVEECISLLTPLARQEGVDLSLDEGGISRPFPFVTADRQRLKQVLLNLISNGVKYNREDGNVRVALRLIDQGRRVKIEVADTGLGISADQIDLVFTPFERLGAEESNEEGVGLGLALSKALVEVMRGTISVVSELGKGTTFSVELASAKDRAVSEEIETLSGEEAAVVPTRSRSRTILYIEDNLSNLKLVERLVARRPGIALVSAMQGGLGVTLARDHRPDLILLDLDLPDVSGEDVLRRLQSDPRTAELPVVVISADATSSQIKRLIAAGARNYLTKPIDVNRFFEIVDEFCPERGSDISSP